MHTSQVIIIWFLCLSLPAFASSIGSLRNPFQSMLVSFFTIASRINVQLHQKKCIYALSSNQENDLMTEEDKIDFLLQHRMINSEISKSISDKYGLMNNRFDRWKFLQNILEEEEEPTYQEINHVLYTTMLKIMVDSSDCDADKTIPILNTQQRQVLLNDLFCLEPYNDDTEMDDKSKSRRQLGVIRALPPDKAAKNNSTNKIYLQTIESLNLLHPNPIDDDDAFKSCWDLVMEMYGKESTKLAEQNGDFSWISRSSIVRLLLHYNFLVDGI